MSTDERGQRGFKLEAAPVPVRGPRAVSPDTSLSDSRRFLSVLPKAHSYVITATVP